MELYTCNTCELELEATEFYKRVGSIPNTTRCKSCTRQYNRDWYESNPEAKQKRRNRASKYREDPEKVIASKERSTKFYASISGRAKTLLKGAQRRSHKFSEPLTVDVEFIQEKLENGFCEVTNLPFDFSPHLEYDKNPYSPSIDRIDSNKGYTKDNTRIVIWQYNLMKGEITDQELLDICKILVEENSE